MVSKIEGIDSLNSFILENEKKIITFILVLFLIVNIFIAINVHSQWAQDSYWHMGLAENMFLGKGYTSDGLYPHGKYPPGLSLLILPFMYLLHDVELSGLVLLSILSLLSLFITYKVGKMVSPSVGLLATVLLFFNSLFLFNSVSIMTEIPFMLFSISSLYFLTKSFEKRKFFILACFLASFSILIRYDGFFLVFPFAFFAWRNKSKLEGLIFSRDFLLAVIAFAIPIGLWFTRNFIVFGSFFHTEYSNELSGVTTQQAFGFLGFFFSLGIIFSVFALFGIISFLSRKDARLNTLLVWILVYLVLHVYWSTRVLRFYVEILPIICILSISGIIFVSTLISNQKRRLLAVILIVLLISGLQVFTFFKGAHQFETFANLNYYESIHQLSDWCNINLPNDSIYVVPDIAVYSLFLKKPHLEYYDSGINYILQNPNSSVYLFADNIHIWMTKPFLSGENGQIVLSANTNSGPVNIIISTNLTKKVVYSNISIAMVMQTRGVSATRG